MKSITKKLAIVVCVLTVLIGVCITAHAKSTNTYSYSTHPNIFQYVGYCQVQGAYVIPQNPAYLLDKYVGERIQQGSIEYKIGTKSLGKAYTKKASSTRDYNIYSVSLKVWDSLKLNAKKTEFYRYWTKF